MDKPYFPAFHDLSGEPVLVVGAGAVAGRKVDRLLAAGARVTVVAPRFSPGLRRLAESGALRGIREPFRPAHLEGMALVFAAAGGPGTNRRVSREARARGIPVNVADSPRECSFILPGIVAADEFTIAVSTGGKHPGAARALREFLDDRREEIAVRLERGRRRGRHRARQGTVYIVGAGPGDPDLLTVRALGLLRSADAVIHDYLVPEDILSLARPGSLRICFSRRGRTAGHGSSLKQDAIHRAMVRLAREGKSVVRLKSGDPLVFGRGGEEASGLARAGVPYEIVPGITAALGCAAAASLPLTHREMASSVTLIAGHEADGKGGAPADWDRLPLGGTVAVYMGVARVDEVVRRLAAAGFPPGTPVAAVESGTRKDQRILRGTLAELPRLAADEALRSPAVLFVGRAAAAENPSSERGHGSVAQGV